MKSVSEDETTTPTNAELLSRIELLESQLKTSTETSLHWCPNVEEVKLT